MRKPIRELRAAPKEINVVDGFNTDEDNEVSTDTYDVEAPELKPRGVISPSFPKSEAYAMLKILLT